MSNEPDKVVVAQNMPLLRAWAYDREMDPRKLMAGGYRDKGYVFALIPDGTNKFMGLRRGLTYIEVGLVDPEVREYVEKIRVGKWVYGEDV